MKKESFKIKTKNICGVKRFYPANELSLLFLKLISVRPVKTFTHEQLKIIKTLSNLLNFEIEEVND